METYNVGGNERRFDRPYEGKVSRDYGEYYVESVLRPAIEGMLSPFDIKSVEAVPERSMEAG